MDVKMQMILHLIHKTIKIYQIDKNQAKG